jgi:hypothetical protein
MTGLMVIFLFISVCLYIATKTQQKERNQILEEYKNVKIALFNDYKKNLKMTLKRKNGMP